MRRTFIWIFAWLCIRTVEDAGAVSVDSAQKRFVLSENSIVLGDRVSSFLVSITMTLGLQCFTECSRLGCAAVKMSVAAGRCELLLLHDASKPGRAELAGTFKHRTLSVETGWLLWKTADFEELLKLSTFPRLLVVNPSPGNGSIESFLVPIAACYRIEARGGRGGSTYPGRSLFTGGRRAFMAGTFNLTAGSRLSIVVGRRGGDASQNEDFAGSGGGGGSFVYAEGAGMPLLVAGGDGGGNKDSEGKPGRNGTSGSTSAVENEEQTGFGGSDGYPGFLHPSVLPEIPSTFGGMGAGWFGKANISWRRVDGGPGGSRLDGWVGGTGGLGNPGAIGGFGGGGGGGESPGASGGGGGFSGGGAGFGGACGGGGGGSYCGGSDCVGVTGGNTKGEHGSVAMEILLGAVCN